MSCFDNNRPKISSSEHIKNRRAKTIYAAVKPQVEKLNANAQYDDDKANNYNGKIVFDAVGNLVSTRTQGLRQDLARGYALCSDCGGDGMEGTGKISNGNINYTKMDTSLIPSASIEYAAANSVLKDTLNNNSEEYSTYQGEFIEIDPDNNIFNTNGGCKKDKFLDYVDVSGNQFTGNNTVENYLTSYNFRSTRSLIDIDDY